MIERLKEIHRYSIENLHDEDVNSTDITNTINEIIEKVNEIINTVNHLDNTPEE